MAGKSLAYFFLGFVAGLIVIESQKDKPFAPVRFHDGKALETRIYYYRYNPYEYNQLYPYGYFRYQPNPYSQGNNSGEYRGNTGGTTKSTSTKSFDHTPQERTDSWGKKN
jgi:hypothetical protein